MFDMFKKTIFTGIGMILKTRDEAEEFARDWANKQQMSEEDGRKFVDDMMKKYDTSMNTMEERVDKMVKDALKKANIATRDELEELRLEVTRLKEIMKPGQETIE